MRQETQEGHSVIYTLRLAQHPGEQPNDYRVEIALGGKDFCQTATAFFSFNFPLRERENLRWYLEDYPELLFTPETNFAALIEQRTREIGVELFRAIFQPNNNDSDSRQIWLNLRQNLNNTRVEIITDITQATEIPWEVLEIPWELLREDINSKPLALQVSSFVRTHENYDKCWQPPTKSEKVRILLVICRPEGSSDVPYRSVATKLLKILTETKNQPFQLDFLRPPTFDQLKKVLYQAKSQGQPYHIVHFDGHGVYEDKKGYLKFELEHPCPWDNCKDIDGKTVGNLLVKNKVPLLILNACRSDYAEIPDKPIQVDENNPQLNNSQAQVSAFCSLAQEVMNTEVAEVMNTRVAGVVAMHYNVYVMTAAQFIANLYASLVHGQTLGEAVTSGRKQLAAQPQRELDYKQISLQDWLVPVVYEAVPIALFPSVIEEISDTPPTNLMLEAQLPPAPDTGFLGRDETLLAIDRAFNHQSIVLLYGLAGSGKSNAAAEFARWYVLTGGVQDAVLFTSFERYLPLPKVLDKLGQVFEQELEREGIHWLALSEQERREVALQKLKQTSVLWIWDNVEPIAGFPDSEAPHWSETEQQELANFLRDAGTGSTEAKFLLTSRRDERKWLGELPVRLQIPPMPLSERVQLLRAIAKKRGYTLNEVKDWFPLLNFTEGNPLTLTVIVQQMLTELGAQAQKSGLTTKEQIEDFIAQSSRNQIQDFVAHLRMGELAIEDEREAGRFKSLSASLSYGFEHAFSEEERKQIALLYLFQGFVDETVLCWMGDSSAECYVPAIRDLSSEAAIALLNRAAEVGLLSSQGKGRFTIHPALPWYFKGLFNRYYEVEATVAIRSFVKAMSTLGAIYSSFYQRGYHDKIFPSLGDEEGNLLQALHWARRNGWWRELSSVIQRIDILYSYSGRHLEWERLVKEVLPDFVDLETKSPLPGREQVWYFVTEYYARLKRESREWEEAEQWYLAQVKWLRLQTGRELLRSPKTLDPARNNPSNPIKSFLRFISRVFLLNTEQLDPEQFKQVSWLATALQELGHIQRAQNKSSCIRSYEEAIVLLYRLTFSPSDEKENAYAMLAQAAFSLAQAYINVPRVCNLDKAEELLRLSGELREEEDYLGKGYCQTQLGLVAYKRFLKARAKNQPQQQLRKYLNQAEDFCSQALDLFPEDALKGRDVTLNQLGLIYEKEGDLDQALHKYFESIRYAELREDIYGAAQTRHNIAGVLARFGRFDEALLYAQAALHGYESCHAADANIQETQDLIERLKKKLPIKEVQDK